MKYITIFLSISLVSLLLFANNQTDNTGINKRDRAANELTADQQTFNVNDTEIVRRIREDIMKVKDISTYAQNIKIIAIKGKVTLKGPVRSQREQNEILKSARLIAGPLNVANEMTTVKKNN